jgi:hypothetical protein
MMGTKRGRASGSALRKSSTLEFTVPPWCVLLILLIQVYKQLL